MQEGTGSHSCRVSGKMQGLNLLQWTATLHAGSVPECTIHPHSLKLMHLMDVVDCKLDQRRSWSHLQRGHILISPGSVTPCGCGAGAGGGGGGGSAAPAASLSSAEVYHHSRICSTTTVNTAAVRMTHQQDECYAARAAQHNTLFRCC